MPVSLMPRYLAQARRDHFNQVLHLFAYLKHHGRSKLVFDAKIPEVSEGWFTKCDWEEFYPGAKEVIPPDALEALGKDVTMGCFVDANFAWCPESPCEKKHNSIAYHKTREDIVAKTIRVAKEPGGTNTADLMTKLMGGKGFTNHFKRCM